LLGMTGETVELRDFGGPDARFGRCGVLRS
jgi:hypothetical protein